MDTLRLERVTLPRVAEIARAVDKELAACSSLGDLVRLWTTDAQIGWRWVNIYLGVELSFAGKSDASAWDVGAVWRKCLLPWSEWMV